MHNLYIYIYIYIHTYIQREREEETDRERERRKKERERERERERLYKSSNIICVFSECGILDRSKQIPKKYLIICSRYALYYRKYI